MDSLDLLNFDYRTVEIQKQIGDSTYIGKVNSSALNYAIKVAKNVSKTDLKSFFKGINYATELWTPSLVPIANASYSKENKIFYIVTKLFSNGSLQSHLEPKVSPQFTPTSAAITILGLAHALKIIHNRGFAHRKLSLSKVVFDDKMYPHLIDSWISDSPQDIRYVAPELMAHNKADEKAGDIFSFALIYFQCACGISPFDGIYQAQIGPYFFSGQRPPIPDSIPAFSKQLIAQCWDQDPRQRPTADQLFNTLLEHYTEIVYDASFQDITKYTKMLYKYPMHCFYSRMGDPSSCIKIGQMLRDYEMSYASQIYMELARTTPQTLQKPRRSFQQAFQPQQQQSYMQNSFMQASSSAFQGSNLDIPRQNVFDQNSQFMMQNQPQNMQQQTIMLNGQQFMMQPVMINGQLMMQPIPINNTQNREFNPMMQQSNGSSSSTKSKRKGKKSGNSSSSSFLSEQERLRMEAEKIRQENERIRAENERMRLEEERNMLERQRDDALRRSVFEAKPQTKKSNRYDSDTFIDTPSIEYKEQSTTDSFSDASSSMSFSSISQNANYKPKPSTHRREELANAKKKMGKSSSSSKRSKKQRTQVTTESIFEAAEKGDIPELQRYIEQEGVSPNVHDTFRSTPLHLACENGHEPAARYLLSKGASVNKTDKWHKTPLHWAAQGGFTSIVKTLLEKGADVNIADKWGSIPLQLAAEKDHADSVALLVDAGSPIEHQDNSGKTAMALSKDENIRAMLQSNGAQPRVCFVLP